MWSYIVPVMDILFVCWEEMSFPHIRTMEPLDLSYCCRPPSTSNDMLYVVPFAKLRELGFPSLLCSVKLHSLVRQYLLWSAVLVNAVL